MLEQRVSAMGESDADSMGQAGRRTLHGSGVDVGAELGAVRQRLDAMSGTLSKSFAVVWVLCSTGMCASNMGGVGGYSGERQ